MKKLLTFGASLMLSASVMFGANGFTGSPAPLVTYVTLPAGVPTIIVGTNNVEVVGITVFTAANSALVSFYDNQGTNAPAWGISNVVSAYVSRLSYSTNLVTTFVGYNGVTNWYTNQGMFSYWTTNAASTNAANPKVAMIATSTTIANNNNSSLFMQGVIGYSTSNATAIVYYIPNK